jgi:hypothetical protein
MDCYDHYFAPMKSAEEPSDGNFYTVCSANFKLVTEKDENIPTLK